ncbi:MAG: TnpV protein [Lachnospiraceae bacterium]|nr:TnpV protein [Lachnospiraceae bacterium]
MAKSLFEQLGGTCRKESDYLIPCLTVPAEEEQPISTWGQRHLDYLKQYRKVTYINLFTSGRLNAYLANVDRQAQERFERLIEDMKQAQGIIWERLKEENALEWTGRMNNIRACAREIVNEEIIFV